MFKLPEVAKVTKSVTKEELAMCRNSLITPDELFDLWWDRRQNVLPPFGTDQRAVRAKRLKFKIQRKIYRLTGKICTNMTEATRELILKFAKRESKI